MNRAMPAVFLIWALVFGLSVLSLLNLKNPPDQEYFFRRTPAEQHALLDPRPLPAVTRITSPGDV